MPRDPLIALCGESLSDAWRKVRESRAGGSETERFAEFRDRPLVFVDRVLGKRLWHAERAMLSAILEHRRVVVRSCRKGGKTFTLGVMVEMFQQLWPSIVISISPTHRQVKEQLWAGVQEIHATARRPLLGKCDTMQLRIGPKHYAIGFSTDKPGRLQGFHAGVEPPDDPDRDLTPEELADRIRAAAEGIGEGTRLLFIFDEAAEVAQALYDAAAGSIVGPNAYIMLAGNPTMDSAEEHEFARAFRDDSGYHRLRITALEDAEDDPDPVPCDEVFVVPNWLLDHEWVERCRRSWGERSPLFTAYVRGRFAAASSDWQLITAALLSSADEREVHADVGVHIGVDLAGDGGDECVAARWAHGVKTDEHVWRGDEMQSAETVALLRRRWGVDGAPLPGECIHVDRGGLGGPIVSRLRQLGVYVDAVDFGGSPTYGWPALTGETRFANRRAEMAWTLRRALQEGVARLPAKFDASYRQHQWAQYELRTLAGETVVGIEPKEKIRIRHGRSPDHADADWLAWARGASVEITTMVRR